MENKPEVVLRAKYFKKMPLFRYLIQPLYKNMFCRQDYTEAEAVLQDLAGFLLRRPEYLNLEELVDLVPFLKMTDQLYDQMYLFEDTIPSLFEWPRTYMGLFKLVGGEMRQIFCEERGLSSTAWRENPVPQDYIENLVAKHPDAAKLVLRTGMPFCYLWYMKTPELFEDMKDFISRTRNVEMLRMTEMRLPIEQPFMDAGVKTFIVNLHRILNEVYNIFLGKTKKNFMKEMLFKTMKEEEFAEAFMFYMGNSGFWLNPQLGLDLG